MGGKRREAYPNPAQQLFLRALKAATQLAEGFTAALPDQVGGNHQAGVVAGLEQVVQSPFSPDSLGVSPSEG